MTWQQFASTRLMKGITPEVAAARGAAAKATAAPKANRKLAQTPPAAWDWRALGKVPAARNQGGCGSCWAFAAVAALESKALIDGTSFSGDLSEQQMVSGWGWVTLGGGLGMGHWDCLAAAAAPPHAVQRWAIALPCDHNPRLHMACQLTPSPPIHRPCRWTASTLPSATAVPAATAATRATC